MKFATRARLPRLFPIRSDEDHGFTLVEVMIIVSIIGLLAAISIPNYRKMRARGRQAEAKSTLASIYQIEKTFAAEFRSYSMCLTSIGWVAPGSDRYYAAGFNPTGGDPVNCGPSGNLTCYSTGYMNSVTGYTSLGTCSTAAPATCACNGYSCARCIGENSGGAWSNTLYVAGQNTFTAFAAGSISGRATLDEWTIDHSRNLVNSLPSL